MKRVRNFDKETEKILDETINRLRKSPKAGDIKNYLNILCEQKQEVSAYTLIKLCLEMGISIKSKGVR